MRRTNQLEIMPERFLRFLSSSSIDVTTDTARELAWLLHQTPRVRWRGEIGACITKVNWSTNRLSIRWILPENRELHTPSNIGIPSNFAFWRKRRRKRKITIPLKDSILDNVCITWITLEEFHERFDSSF